MRSAQRSFIPIFALVAASPMLGQTSTIDVLVILKNQPQKNILEQMQRSWFANRLAQPRGPSRYDLLGARQTFAVMFQSAVGIEQAQMYGRLTALGASEIVPHSVINALSATVPPSAVNALETDAAGAKVVPQTALDLFKLLDQTVTSSANTSISAGLTSRLDDALSQVIDDVVDLYQLTLVLRGPPGSAENAITVAPAATLDDPEKVDFILPDRHPQSIFDALGVLENAGVLDPLVKKVLLVNSADSNGWNPNTGWGKIDPSALAPLPPSPQGIPPSHDPSQ